MSIKIGDMLIKAGIITMPQLDETLKQQVIFGGKLGTNLLELGLIDEEALAFFLSEKLGVPYVHPSQFENVPKDILNLIPQKVVEKHKVFPIEIRKKRLLLIMPNPTDMNLIDEISFMINMQIQPVIAPEIRLVMALEKYYGMQKDIRYVSLIDKHVSAGPAEENLIELEEEADTAESEADDLMDGLDFLIQDDDDVAPDSAAISASTLREEVIKKYTVDDISKDMANAGNRDEVANFLIEYVNQKFLTAAIFVIWEKHVRGWKATGPAGFVGSLRNLKLSLSDHLPFKRVYETKAHYLGPHTKSPLTAALENAETGSELIMPIIMNDVVISFFYVCGPKEELKEMLDEYDGIANKASLAFQMLIYKNKILMT